jgi:hypothetical protein
LTKLYVLAEKWASARNAAIAGLVIEGFYFEADDVRNELEYFLAELNYRCL